MIVALSQLGNRLHGKTAGRGDYARLCSCMADASLGQIVFLDFSGIDLVNGSWLNMAVAPLLRWAAESQNDLYPILTQFPGAWLDELELVAQINGQCYGLTEKSELPIKRMRLIGPLDEALRETFSLVAKFKTVTGAELARRVPEAQILPSAWNNRLKDLHDKRLVVRRKEGRQQIYSPLAEEVHDRG